MSTPFSPIAKGFLPAVTASTMVRESPFLPLPMPVRGADIIDSYLKGDMVPYSKPYIVTRQDLTEEDFLDRAKIPRAIMAHLSPEERKRNFKEVNFRFYRRTGKGGSLPLLGMRLCRLFPMQTDPLRTTISCRSPKIFRRTSETEISCRE